MNNDVIVVENYVDSQCMRHVHLISNAEYGLDVLTCYGAKTGLASKECGAWHYRATYAYRGPLDIACVGNEKKFRRFVVWNLEGCASVKAAISDACMEFCKLFGGKPQYAFMAKLPKGAVSGQHLALGVCELDLFEAEWMLEKCVAVGGKQ